MKRALVIPTLVAAAAILPALPSEEGVRPCTVHELCAPPQSASGDELAPRGPRGLQGPLASSVAGSSVTGPTGPSHYRIRAATGEYALTGSSMTGPTGA